MTDKLFDAIQMAAGQLPEGWIVELCIERGAGWVELYDPDGARHELKEMPDASLAEEVDAAVDEAQRASGLAPSPTLETQVDCPKCGYKLQSIAHFEHCGHGHVTKRHDGMLAKCGGPSICKACAAEKEAVNQP